MAVLPEDHAPNNVFVLLQPDITTGHMTFIGTYSVDPAFLRDPQEVIVEVD